MATGHGQAALAYRRRSIPRITVPFRAFPLKKIIARIDRFVNKNFQKNKSIIYLNRSVFPYYVPSMGMDAQGPRYFTDRCGFEMLFVCLTSEGSGAVMAEEEGYILLPGDLMVLASSIRTRKNHGTSMLLFSRSQLL